MVMSDATIAVIISSIFTLAGTCLTVWAANKKTIRTYETEMAVLRERVEQLKNIIITQKIAERLTVLEERQNENERRFAALEKLR